MKRRIFLRCFGVAAAAVMVCCVLSGFIISLVEEKSLADSLLQMETVLLGQYDLEQESEETAHADDIKVVRKQIRHRLPLADPADPRRHRSDFHPLRHLSRRCMGA